MSAALAPGLGPADAREAARQAGGLWWLGLVSGILMCVLAFWTAGQFFFQKAYTLLVIAGFWALMHGVTDIIRAFRLRMGRDLG